MTLINTPNVPEIDCESSLDHIDTFGYSICVNLACCKDNKLHFQWNWYIVLLLSFSFTKLALYCCNISKLRISCIINSLIKALPWHSLLPTIKLFFIRFKCKPLHNNLHLGSYSNNFTLTLSWCVQSLYCFAILYLHVSNWGYTFFLMLDHRDEVQGMLELLCIDFLAKYFLNSTWTYLLYR